MSKRTRHAPEFKAKVALEALKGEETADQIGEITRRFHTTKIRNGHRRFSMDP